MQSKVVDEFKCFKIFEIKPLDVLEFLYQFFDLLQHQNEFARAWNRLGTVVFHTNTGIS